MDSSKHEEVCHRNEKCAGHSIVIASDVVWQEENKIRNYNNNNNNNDRSRLDWMLLQKVETKKIIIIGSVEKEVVELNFRGVWLNRPGNFFSKKRKKLFTFLNCYNAENSTVNSLNIIFVLCIQCIFGQVYVDSMQQQRKSLSRSLRQAGLIGTRTALIVFGSSEHLLPRIGSCLSCQRLKLSFAAIV